MQSNGVIATAGHGSLNPPDQPMIALRLDRAEQLFDPLDPSPLPERRLASSVSEYLEDRISEFPADAPIALRIYLSGDDRLDDRSVAAAVRNHFARAATRKRRELREVFKSGAVMMVTGVACALVLITIARLVSETTENRVLLRVASVITVLVWVILWRPLETLVYGWPPIQKRLSRLSRLSSLDVVCVRSPG